MAPSELVSFRTKPGTTERAERIAEFLEEQTALQGLGISRSRVLSMALLRGLDLLEEEHGLAKKKRGKR
jgi:hypothetical protein